MGAYSRWALIQGWALINFSPFSTSLVCFFCNKTINGDNKTRRCNKERFLENALQKTPSLGKSLISTYSISMSGRGTGVGAYSRLGAY